MQLARNDMNQHPHNWYQSLVNLQFLLLLQKDVFGIFTQPYVVNFILIYHWNEFANLIPSSFLAPNDFFFYVCRLWVLKPNKTDLISFFFASNSQKYIKSERVLSKQFHEMFQLVWIIDYKAKLMIFREG